MIYGLYVRLAGPIRTWKNCTTTFDICQVHLQFELDEAIFPQNCWPTAMHVKTMKTYEHVHSEMQVKRPIMSNTRYPRYS